MHYLSIRLYGLRTFFLQIILDRFVLYIYVYAFNVGALQGKRFENQVFQIYLNKFEIIHNISSPYNERMCIILFTVFE
jgi:hypothetical protein